MAKKDWFYRGKEGEKKLGEEQERRKQSMSTKTWRWFLAKGETGKVLFLDDDGFCFFEHNLRIGGNWGNHETCLKELDSCALCNSGDRNYFIGAFTVVDLREIKSKDGTKTYKNVKKLFMAKSTILEKLNRYREKHGGLRGCVFEIHRTNQDQSPSTGDDFDFIEKLSDKAINKIVGTNKDSDGNKVTSDAFNYVEMFEPLSAEAMADKYDLPGAVGSSKDLASTKRETEYGGEEEDEVDKYL